MIVAPECRHERRYVAFSDYFPILAPRDGRSYLCTMRKDSLTGVYLHPSKSNQPFNTWYYTRDAEIIVPTEMT